MTWMSEEFLRRSFFDDPACIHDYDAVGHACHHSKITVGS